MLLGLEILEVEGTRVADTSDYDKVEMVEFLSLYWDTKSGGFASSSGCLPHLGTSYPAILAIALLESEDAYEIVDRGLFKKFILSCRSEKEHGAYCIHIGGETDLRATYMAVLAAKLFNFMDDSVTDGVAEHIARCQTYEGGIAPTPNTEAHAGYTFCGVAALALLGKLDSIDVMRLVDWACNKQKVLEGGFCGRTNKLVDSCYSVWLGSVFAILNQYLRLQFQVEQGHMLYDQLRLQQYILIGRQTPGGDLVDKIGKKVDFYHTSYSLSGLSMAQRLKTSENPEDEEVHLFEKAASNKLVDINPAYNLPRNKVTKMLAYFNSV